MLQFSHNFASSSLSRSTIKATFLFPLNTPTAEPRLGNCLTYQLIDHELLVTRIFLLCVSRNIKFDNIKLEFNINSNSR